MRVILLPRDGFGPEITAATTEVLNAANHPRLVSLKRRMRLSIVVVSALKLQGCEACQAVEHEDAIAHDGAPLLALFRRHAG